VLCSSCLQMLTACNYVHGCLKIRSQISSGRIDSLMGSVAAQRGHLVKMSRA
jgi:hypothetical protein